MDAPYSALKSSSFLESTPSRSRGTRPPARVARPGRAGTRDQETRASRHVDSSIARTGGWTPVLSILEVKQSNQSPQVAEIRKARTQKKRSPSREGAPADLRTHRSSPLRRSSTSGPGCAAQPRTSARDEACQPYRPEPIIPHHLGKAAANRQPSTLGNKRRSSAAAAPQPRQCSSAAVGRVRGSLTWNCRSALNSAVVFFGLTHTDI